MCDGSRKCQGYNHTGGGKVILLTVIATYVCVLRLFSHLVSFAGPNSSAIIPPAPTGFLSQFIWLWAMVCVKWIMLCFCFIFWIICSFLCYHKWCELLGQEIFAAGGNVRWICSFACRADMHILKHELPCNGSLSSADGSKFSKKTVTNSIYFLVLGQMGHSGL